EMDRWVIKDGEDHYFKDAEPALHHFREKVFAYIDNKDAFIQDNDVATELSFVGVLPTPLYDFFLEKHNANSLSEEEREIAEAIELILVSFSFDERVEDEDFLVFRNIDMATEKERHYSYQDSDYQVKITIEKETFEIDCVKNQESIHLKTNALSTNPNKPYRFQSRQTILRDDKVLEERNLNITFEKNS
ncbi:MAG: hypothetical protein K5694_05265, partial [Bacilli bacterium]|nr:hypothetical protein [Bacilli bacterium]